MMRIQQNMVSSATYYREKRAARMRLALLLAVLTLCLAAIADKTSGFIHHYTALAAENEALVQCLNGHILNLDGALVTCNVHQASVVAEVRP